MGRRLCSVLALSLLAVATRSGADPAAPPPDADLRERLTEREDENRVEDPFTLPVFGHPLSINGQYEITLEGTDPFIPGEPPDDDDRLVLEQELEVELFYSLGVPISFFAQFRVGHEWDALGDTREGLSHLFLERGEGWIFAEDVLGSGLDLEIGRLDFEDDRVWWWDEDLDALRISWEGEALEVSLALAYELARVRSNQDFIEPEQDERFRLFAEVSWDWAKDQGLQLLALYDDDRSEHFRVGETVRKGREDESDARLLWLGARAVGGVRIGKLGLLGYWADAGFVRGRERLVSFAEPVAGRSAIEEVSQRSVMAWGFDVGGTWILPLPLEPRLTLGYAMGSGDGSPDRSKDRAYRQTGLQSNETGFGGVQRFARYGRLLDPELSNLRVATLGVGISLFRSSSVDLVYHHYRLVDLADGLRDARIETPLTGLSRSLGQGLDLVVAIEEWERVELEFSASVFRSGAAFGGNRREWAHGGFAAFRFAF